MAGFEQPLQRLARGARAFASGRSAPRPSRAPASAARRGSARRSRGSIARGRYPRSAARATPPPRGEQPVVERRARAADVQRAGRRRSEANPHEAAMLIGAHVSPAGGLAEGGRARRRARLRARSRSSTSRRACGGRPRTARRTSPPSARRWTRQPDRGGADPRRLPAQLRAATTRTIRAKSLASLIHSLRVGDAIGARGVVLHPGSAKTGDVGEAIARAGDDRPRGARRERALPAAPREHRRRRRHARALVRGARGADRGRRRRQAARRVPRLVPPARLGL